MNPTQMLASYVVEAKFGDFPEKVVRRAKHCLLDSIGCALGGAQTDVGQQYIRMARDQGGNRESTVIGDGTRVSCMSAAYTNALLCVALDFDDTYLYALSHPGGPIIHSALPAAEMVSASGKELITAVILGYEVSLRIGRALRSIVMEEGRQRVLFSSSYTVFGSATSAARLLGLNKQGIISAFGIAGNQIPGTPRGSWQGGTPAKLGEAKLGYQIHTFLGNFAAWQAYKGLMGPVDILDGDIFWTTSGANSCDYTELSEDLGRKYRIMEVGFKPEPSCRLTHHSTTAIKKALEGEVIKAQDVEEIKLAQAILLPPTYEWDTMVQAQFSLPCAVAMSIAGGEPGPSWYTTGRFRNPDIHELARKVKFFEDREAGELWVQYGKLVCHAEVKTGDGKVRKAYVEYPKGEPENPLAEEELQQKFMTNAVGTLGQKQAEELRDRLLHLEDVHNVSTLADLLHSSV